MAGNIFARNIPLFLVFAFMAAVAYLDGPKPDTDDIGLIVLISAIAAMITFCPRGGGVIASPAASQVAKPASASAPHASGTESSADDPTGAY